MSSVFVPGIPQQKGNIIKGKWGGYHDTNKKLRPWMQQVVTTITEAGWEPILHGPVCVDITFVFPRPKAHYGSGRNANVLKAAAPLWHTKAPDLDKLIRSILDALTEAGVVTDDGQVCRVTAVKCFTTPEAVRVALVDGLAHPGAWIAMSLRAST